jgi:hypothetical protein
MRTDTCLKHMQLHARRTLCRIGLDGMMMFRLGYGSFGMWNRALWRVNVYTYIATNVSGEHAASIPNV